MNNKYKILLVEDEQNISTLVMTMLETAGYQVIPAGTCAMAKHCLFLIVRIWSFWILVCRIWMV